MRQCVICLAAVISVSGCSILFNPNNIAKQPVDAAPKMDAPPPDTMIDADKNPADLKLTAIAPSKIYEGAGDTANGGQPAIVALQGNAFIKDPSANLTVTLTPSTAVTLLDHKVSSGGDFIVLALQVPVDTTCDSGTIPLTVTITENGASPATQSNMLAVQCLPQITMASQLSPTDNLADLYSKIELSGTTISATGSKPLILRSASHITISADIDVSGVGKTAGPGGGGGGAEGADGTGLEPGKGSANGGGGGGFVANGQVGGGGNGGAGGMTTGDPYIADYAANASSGGGGGSHGTSLGTITGHSEGGGGGGTVELTANGNVSVGKVSAVGGNGTITSGGFLLAPNSGGAGTGGVILVRSGGTLTVGALGAGPGMPADATGGTSSVGRIRADSAAAPPGSATPGPMFVPVPPLNTQYPTIHLIGPQTGQVTMIVHDAMGFPVYDSTNMPYMPSFSSGQATVNGVVLKVGYNRICVTVPGGNTSEKDFPQANNCIEVGYVSP